MDNHFNDYVNSLVSNDIYQPNVSEDLATKEQRTKLISFLKENLISAMFHYVPLHSSKAGLRFTRFHGQDRYTTRDSERLLRLPLFYDLTMTQVKQVIEAVKSYFDK